MRQQPRQYRLVQPEPGRREPGWHELGEHGLGQQPGLPRYPAASDRFVAHEWVGAALVGLGRGDNARAEHADRTGRHVLTARTRVEVLEVYCGNCRVAYSDRACRQPCISVATRVC